MWMQFRKVNSNWISSECETQNNKTYRNNNSVIFDWGRFIEQETQ